MNEQIFEIGETVVATGNYMHQITEGNEYIVIGYQHPFREEDGSFTWPAYVTVIGDFGKKVIGHTYRFKHKE